MICQVCATDNDRLCTVSMFIDGFDTDKKHNTIKLAEICTFCVMALMEKKIVIPAPDVALSIADLWGTKE